MYTRAQIGDYSRLLREIPLDTEERERLFSSPVFCSLVQSLVDGFLLLAVVDVDDGLRRILKYAYSGPLYPPDERSTAQSVGLATTQIDIAVPLVGEGASYHLEVHVPEDLLVVSALLRSRSADMLREDIQPGHGSMAHVYLRDVDLFADGDAQVELAASPSGMVRATVVSTWGIAISLTLAACFAPRIAKGSDAATALLLVVPGVLSTVVSRPGEHRLTSVLMRGYRWIVALAACCAFLASGAIALQVQGTALRLWCLLLGSIAVTCAVLVSLASLTPTRSRGTHNSNR